MIDELHKRTRSNSMMIDLGGTPPFYNLY